MMRASNLSFACLMPFVKAPGDIGRDLDFNAVRRRDEQSFTAHNDGNKALPFRPVIQARMVWNVAARSGTAFNCFHASPLSIRFALRPTLSKPCVGSLLHTFTQFSPQGAAQSVPATCGQPGSFVYLFRSFRRHDFKRRCAFGRFNHAVNQRLNLAAGFAFMQLVVFANRKVSRPLDKTVSNERRFAAKCFNLRKCLVNGVNDLHVFVMRRELEVDLFNGLRLITVIQFDTFSTGKLFVIKRELDEFLTQVHFIFFGLFKRQLACFPCGKDAVAFGQPFRGAFDQFGRGLLCPSVVHVRHLFS
ncbi:peptidase [Xanthomonas phage Langgrundblatt2]|uniref:Peptidase n=1 Tax=Xanthomonas phage Langgrundblatt2 TaxID=2939129 RepID=A0A9E7E1A4_9CAUD|nr:peptidase [Xanthomonas phage Langgrundblatt2]URA06893.1 peptidase [Xanthomonas phage Langgrundblatt2]